MAFQYFDLSYKLCDSRGHFELSKLVIFKNVSRVLLISFWKETYIYQNFTTLFKWYISVIDS